MDFSDLGPKKGKKAAAIDFSDLGPAAQTETQDSMLGMAGQAVGEALETPITTGLGMVGDVMSQANLPGAMAFKAASMVPIDKVKSGIEIATADAGKYYSELGVPRLGAAIEAGGRFAVGAIPSTMKDALFIAAAAPAIKLAGFIGKPVARVGGNIIADIAGQVAGRSPEAIKAMYRSPGAIWKKASEVFSLKHQELLVQHIDEGLAARGSQFKQLEDAMSGFTETSAKGTVPRVSLKPVAEDVTKEMLWRGHRLPKKMTGKEPVLVGRIAETAPEYRAIVQKLEFMKKTPELKFGEALNLRRQLDDMINYGVEGSNGLQQVSGEGNRVLKLMRRRLNNQLRNSVPAEIRPSWDKANFEYSRASSAYAELKKQVVRGDPGGTESKLLQLIQTGRYDDEVINRANRLSEQTARAMDDIRDHLAAREFSKWASGGIGKGAFGLLPTSPRIVGGLASGAGAVSKSLGAVARPLADNPITSALGIRGYQGVLNQP